MLTASRAGKGFVHCRHGPLINYQPDPDPFPMKASVRADGGGDDRDTDLPLLTGPPVRPAGAWATDALRVTSAQNHSDDSADAPPRFPGEGRDPLLPWAPAFAGEAGSGIERGALLPGESCE